MWLKCVLFQRVYFELKRRVRIQTQIRAIWLVKIKASLWGGEGGAFVLKGLHRIEKTEFLSLIDLFGPPVWVQGFLKCKEAIVLTLFFAVDFSSNKILELDQTLWKSLLIFPHYIFPSFPRVIFRYISFTETPFPPAGNRFSSEPVFSPGARPPKLESELCANKYLYWIVHRSI